MGIKDEFLFTTADLFEVRFLLLGDTGIPL
jgi:hypothetical protein